MEKLNVLIIRFCLFFSPSIPKCIQIKLLLLVRKHCLSDRNENLKTAYLLVLSKLGLSKIYDEYIIDLIPVFTRYNAYKYCGGTNNINQYWFHDYKQRVHFIHWCIRELKK